MIPNLYRHTKIIITLGPATLDEAVFRKLLLLGLDIVRLNMAHASKEWTEMATEMVRRVSKSVGRDVAILMDIKGPEVRTGDVSDTLQLEEGEVFDFYVSTEAQARNAGNGIRSTTVNYPGLMNDVKVGDTMLVDSGLIRMQVQDVTPERLRCGVLIPGPLGKRRHINLPGVKVNLPSLTEKDKRDVLTGIACGVDFYALSFVREGSDLDLLRRFMSDNGSQAPIIAKIEDQSAVTNLSEIIRAADGLMVARGDLGIEVPFEKLPIIQRRIVNACIAAGKPVIVATHMLESMITQPMPTRAEITDVANAVFEQADCVMLSAETTVGKYPVECVEVLNRIIGECEQAYDTYISPFKPKTPKGKLLSAAATLATELQDAAIVVFTRQGTLARSLSALRPWHVPIYAFTDVKGTFSELLITWGVEPFLMEFSDEPEKTVQDAIAYLKRRNWVKQGTPLVFITNVLAGELKVDTVQLRWVE
ncbi:MAG: pyruvate kinase [Verrucomicrobiota bacterium]|nr:pyruvate kinase [Verrucomicrobiota bacterium]